LTRRANHGHGIIIARFGTREISASRMLMDAAELVISGSTEYAPQNESAAATKQIEGRCDRLTVLTPIVPFGRVLKQKRALDTSGKSWAHGHCRRNHKARAEKSAAGFLLARHLWQVTETVPSDFC
jgi:hypothetical protein